MTFSPKTGWTNDPNGLIVINGIYHLFFQHYPDDIIWGPMHWGHAISKDGIEWEELEIAIYPDEDGYVFSGSAVLDEDNVAGFNKDGIPALICIYTQHNSQSGEQQQCIAYSTDYVHFTKYEGNPVICNRISDKEYKRDFRDPKVIKNPVSGGYTMVIAAGERLEFYNSNNLKEWELTGNFDVAKYLGTGISECPDCFHVDGKWILSLSYIPQSVAQEDVGDFKERHTMNYFVGDFDGKTFVADKCEDGSKLIDYGPDNYAMVSFANSSEVLTMGWAENWDYVYDIPCEKSRGKMTSIRKLNLIDTPKGKYLSAKFIDGSEKMTVRNDESIVLDFDGGGQLKITVTPEQLFVTRDAIKGTEESRWLSLEGYNVFCAPRIYNGSSKLEYKLHRNFCEILADEGCISFTVNV